MKKSIFVIAAALLLYTGYRIHTAEAIKGLAPEKSVTVSVVQPVDDFQDLNELANHFGSDQSLIAQNSPLDFSFMSAPSITSQEFTPAAPIFQSRDKSPMLAATLALVPGLGHVYLNDMKTAGALAGSAGLGMGLYFGSTKGQIHSSGVIGLQTTGFYGIYAAYRDARMQNGMSAYGYRMPTENLADLAYAPFQWSVLKKPEVWGGIVVTLGMAVGALFLADSEPSASLGTGMPYLALPIGIGEEAFFRGFLQSALAESCTPWGGISLSSLAFGAAHIPNAFDLPRGDRWGYYAFGIPLLTGLGAYWGWLTYKNHSLKESVAVHTWYDFIIMVTSSVIARRASTGQSGFSVSFPF